MDKQTLQKNIVESKACVDAEFEGKSAPIGIILGSGLGPFADKMQQDHSIETINIPHYPESTVQGHKGRLILGTVNGIKMIAVQGRVHSYEGYEQWQVTYPVRLLHALGVTNLIVSNAAGATDPAFKPGEFMLIKDHLNYLHRQPLESWEQENSSGGTPYDEEFGKIAHNSAEECGIILREGLLAANLGPTYETPAEIRFQRTFGASSASMSTLPEATVANYLGMRVVSFSVFTNYSAGLSVNPLSHEEVTEMADIVGEKFSEFISTLIQNISTANQVER